MVFSANSLIAFFAPPEFIELIGKSFLAGILPIDVRMFVFLIGLNDAIVALLLFFGVGVSRKAAWATVWLAGVAVIDGTVLGALEHLGLLFVSLALVFDGKHSKQKYE